MEHRYQLTNECEESIEVLQVGVEPLQAVVIEQLEKLLF